MAVRRKARKVPLGRLEEIDSEFREMLGLVVTMWANAESWLPRVLAILLRIDVGRAGLIHSSFTSTRARVQLVERAAVMCLRDARRVRHLKKLTSEFATVTRMRNSLCHSEYSVDRTESAFTGMWAANFDRRDFDGTNAYKFRDIDRGMINEMRGAYLRARSLCGRFERFVKNAPPFVLERPRDTPLPPPQTGKSKSRLPRLHRTQGHRRPQKPSQR